MSKPMPRVSVVMSVYNGERYLRQAIESILAQTFRDFEFIIINDGSTDSTAHILAEVRDERIVLAHNGANIGLTCSLNCGLALARGEYIARMDADDISHPERFARQIAFLDAHPNYGLVGSWFEIIDLDGQVIGQARMMVDHDEIMLFLLHDSHFAHSAVMFRRACIDAVGPYDEAAGHVEDYELWLRISRHFRLYNLPAFLHQWRYNTATGISVTRRAEQLPLLAQVKRPFLAEFAATHPQPIDILTQALALHPHDELLRARYDESWRAHVAALPPDDPGHAELRLTRELLLALGDPTAARYNQLAEHYQRAGNPSLAFLCAMRSLTIDPAQGQAYQRAVAERERFEQRARDQALTFLPDACAVSVIMTTYNRHATIHDSIRSVLSQTFQDFELIIVNDGGTDEVEQIARSFGSGPNDKIRYLKTAHCGSWAALNAGLRAARGSYIAYLDDDDSYDPHHLATLTAAIRDTGAEFVYTKSRVVSGRYEGGSFVAEADLGTYTQDFSPERMAATCIIMNLDVLHTRRGLAETGLFNTDFPVVGDWECWGRWARRGRPLHLDVYTSEVRRRNDNISVRQRPLLLFIMDLLRAYYQSNYGTAALARAAWALGRDDEAEQWLRRLADAFFTLSEEQYVQLFPLIFGERRPPYTHLQELLAVVRPDWFTHQWARRVFGARDTQALLRASPRAYRVMFGFALRRRGLVARAVVKRIRRRIELLAT